MIARVNGIRNANQNSDYQILGIGTPILDYLLSVSDEYVESLGLRGGSILIDYKDLQKILSNQSSIEKISAGGSAANTLKGLAQLGHSCGIIGKTGQDEAARQFTENMKHYGVFPHLSISTLPTAQVACLITPDHERTMRAYIGAGAEMNASDMTIDFFKNVNLVHIEGYLINRQGVVEKAMKLAKKAKAKISFDLSSFEIIDEYREAMQILLKGYVDIVFANAEEAQMLTGFPPEEACMLLRDLCGTAIVKMGDKGCWGATKTEKVFHPAYQVKVVDTTGAGDLFASGFLHGFLLNKSLEESLRYGSLVASYVIQTFGAEVPLPKWPEIRKSL
ncbi:MAG TPA: adenosine kinase [Parachlamydiaceae bacterium]|nr:adenosine kinase [Parachlamydiaceae bacterium]